MGAQKIIPLQSASCQLSQEKNILVIGGSSGIGYGVAKGALLSDAAHVTISSSSPKKVDAALAKLQTELSSLGLDVAGRASGDVVDAKSSESVKALLARVGEIDHLVWTSGGVLRLGCPEIDLDQNRDVFDINFWGAFTAAQFAKIRAGGSITLKIGSAVVKPAKGWSLIAGMAGATDALTRGLAVDLAPVRVNVVSPGLVNTEFWDTMEPETRKHLQEDVAKKLLVQHVADADEVAEAYLFIMKCGYITGQRLEVDGGQKLI